MAPKKRAPETAVEVRRSPFRRLPAGFWTGALVLMALAVRLAWLAYTRFTGDDAFIIFRFARQIAQGNGFVYNLGERIDGTTTPLLTLLLAAWFKLSTNVILGARLLNVCAAGGAFLLVWLVLKRLGRSTAEQAAVILLLGLSSKLCLTDTQGMETPLVLFLMAASWYALVRQHYAWSGVLAGLLLWTRVDLFLWPLILAVMTALSDVKSAFRLTLAAFATYLPWIVFATLYFGSPIPYTITAKWVAYIQFNREPLLNAFLTVMRYLSPFDVHTPGRVNTLLVLTTLALAVYQTVRTWRNRLLLLPAAFAVLDLSRLVLTRAIFSNRYLIPALWAILVLAGLGAGKLLGRVKDFKPVVRWGFMGLVALTLIAGVKYGLDRAVEARNGQIYRNERSLKAIGVWLNEHTPPGTRVELEPLGYIGYYSDRTMLDEVGLVTPAVVDLKRRQVRGDSYFSYLKPDYLVLHCDDALRMQGQLGGLDTGLAADYVRVEQFNPLDYDPFHPEPWMDSAGTVRNSCYEVWQNK